MYQRPNFERFQNQERRVSVPVVNLSDLKIQQLLDRGRRERSRMAIHLARRLWHALRGRS